MPSQSASLLAAGKPCASCGCCQPWAGVYPTVLTPWNCDCTVDEASLEAQLRYEVAGGVHGVLVLGSLGEGERASAEARAQVLAVTARTVTGCVPFVVGIHTCDVECAKPQMLQAKEAGAAAVLVKYKGNPHASGCQVLAFYQELSDLRRAADPLLPLPHRHRAEAVAGRDRRHRQAAERHRGENLDARPARVRGDRRATTKCCGKVYLTGTALNLTQFMDAGGHGAMCPEAVLLPAQDGVRVPACGAAASTTPPGTRKRSCSSCRRYSAAVSQRRGRLARR